MFEFGFLRKDERLFSQDNWRDSQNKISWIHRKYMMIFIIYLQNLPLFLKKIDKLEKEKLNHPVKRGTIIFLSRILSWYPKFSRERYWNSHWFFTIVVISIN